MIARVLSLSGLHLGAPDRLMPPNSSNVLGYFEDPVISYDINDALLSHFGGSWDSPPDLPKDWEKDSSLELIYADAISHTATLSEHRHWGWKDPRTALLLPFWKSLVADLKFVICIRNPLEVAKSLQLRDGIPIDRGIKLWTQYVESIIRGTESNARILVFYEDFFKHTHKEITKLTEFCNLSCAFNDTLAKNTIHKSLNHSQVREEYVDASDTIITAITLYKSLRQVNLKKYKNNTASTKKMVTESYQNDKPLSQPTIIPKHQMEFPRYEQPLVSIIIPTFNKAGFLVSCLRSIYLYTDLPYEVIVVDDGSTDETSLLLDNIQNIVVVRNECTLDFLKSTNKGASLAKGKYIQFLNNDVMVRPNWLSQLVHTMENYPKCGAVGGRLILMNGKLQEAGGIINYCGSSELYGANDDPFKPEYGYVREVDYCSAACLLVRRGLFEQLGGFDMQYAPAYFEDADLCFEILHLGYKVVYQPDVVSFHYMMGSRDIDQANLLYSTNLPKFKEKWSSVLALREQENSILDTRNRRQGKKVLILGQKIPSTQLDDVSDMQTNELIGYHLQEGHLVTFMPIENRYRYSPFISQLQQKGVEVLYGTGFEPYKLLQSRLGFYHKVIIYEFDKHQDYVDLARSCFPDANITVQKKN